MNDVAAAFDEHAREWAELIRTGCNYAYRYLEKPAMYAKLPALSGKSVLCIGCGSGEECAHIASLGARRVVGIDASGELIKIAQASYPGIEFKHLDMEQIAFDPGEFDFAYSSLALHYVEDWSSVLRAVHRCLTPGAKLLFSTHHPVWWCAESAHVKDGMLQIAGFCRIHDRLSIHGDYLNPHRLAAEICEGLTVAFYHKPFAEIFAEIRASGFSLEDVVEPRPLPELADVDPDFHRLLNRFPLFVIFESVRPPQ